MRKTVPTGPLSDTQRLVLRAIHETGCMTDGELLALRPHGVSVKVPTLQNLFARRYVQSVGGCENCGHGSLTAITPAGAEALHE